MAVPPSRVAATGPVSVLELAAGTGIVTRKLRDALPPTCELLATDLNAPMLENARARFRAGEAVEFREADAMALSGSLPAGASILLYTHSTAACCRPAQAHLSAAAKNDTST